MARYRGAVCRLCRREGMSCSQGRALPRTKCSIERRGYAPGQHGSASARSRTTGCACARSRSQAHVGCRRRSSATTSSRPRRADHRRGAHPVARAAPRQRRLPLRLRSSRSQARQLVLHGTLLVNGKPVNIPSFLVRKDDASSRWRAQAAGRDEGVGRGRAARGCPRGSSSTARSSSAG